MPSSDTRSAEICDFVALLRTEWESQGDFERAWRGRGIHHAISSENGSYLSIKCEKVMFLVIFALSMTFEPLYSHVLQENSIKHDIRVMLNRKYVYNMTSFAN